MLSVLTTIKKKKRMNDQIFLCTFCVRSLSVSLTVTLSHNKVNFVKGQIF